jgi:hypothetical protein
MRYASVTKYKKAIQTMRMKFKTAAELLVRLEELGYNIEGLILEGEDASAMDSEVSNYHCYCYSYNASAP